MAVTFTIKKVEYTYPEGYQDVTLSRFLESITIIGPKPKALQMLHSAEDKARRNEAWEEIFRDDSHVYKFELMPYFVKYVCFWCNIPMTTLGTAQSYNIRVPGIKIKKNYQWVETLYQQIETNFNRSLKASQEFAPSIEHNGQTWFLPSQHMTDSTVNEFIEISQYEHNAKLLSKNQFSALPKMLCILLKKTPNAPYNPQQLKREPIFLQMVMNKVFQVSFFLLKLNEKLLQSSLIYTVASRLALLQLNEEQELKK